MSDIEGVNGEEIDEQTALSHPLDYCDQTSVQNIDQTDDTQSNDDKTEDIHQIDFFHSLQQSLTDEEDTCLDSRLRNNQFIWTSPMVYALIDEYRKLIIQFRDPKMRQKDLWIQVADGMQKKSFNVDYQMCDRKWRNLKQTFKSIYYDRRKKRQRTWEFYEILQIIFAPDPRSRIQRKSRMVLPMPEDGTATILTIPKRKRIRYAKVDAYKDLNYREPSPMQEREWREEIHEQDADTSQEDGDEEPPSEEVTFEEQEVEYKEVEGPAWFQIAMENLRADQRARVAEARRMHRELLEAEKRKCDLLEALLRVLQPPQG